MAHFYGKLAGQAGEATRVGSRNSGISATVRTWDGNLETRIDYLRNTDRDLARILVVPEHGSPHMVGAFDHGNVCRALDTGDTGVHTALAAVQEAINQLDAVCADVVASL